jgi:hypothetical protein
MTSRMGADLPLSAMSLETWVCYASFIAVALLFCWGLSLVTERQYHRLRAWLLQRLGWEKSVA